MEGNRVPAYYGLRIYFSSTVLYFFLVFPFFLFIGFQSIPRIMENRDLLDGNVTDLVDSLATMTDSLTMMADTLDRQEIDSIISHAFEEEIVALNVPARDTLDLSAGNSGEKQGGVNFHAGSEGPFQTYFILAFFLTILSYLVGFIYNRPFKRHFRQKRKKKKIRERTTAYCRKHLFRMPWINGLILILPNIAVIVYSVLFVLTGSEFESDVEHSMFIQLIYLTLVATLLEFLFALYWQRHRVHIRYIQHLYTAEELRVRVNKKRGLRIRDRFLVASGMTTFLPLMIVMVYLILSFTSIKSMDLGPLSREQREILIGPWIAITGSDSNSDTTDEDGGIKIEEDPPENNAGSDGKDTDSETFERLFYVNAIDSLVMLVGIGSGILISLVYLLLFIKWTNQDISLPLKELLASIRSTRTGEQEHYSLVRSNDEIGELAEGYNEMTKKIHDYVENISRMNRDLEDKVKERTEEVVLQKEEIEAQKEEIEAQLDLVTQQKDTISRQNEKILDSIRYAEKIQSALIPHESDLSEVFRDYFILFKPRDIVSGDYYWTSFKENRIMVAVADCTGHGVPGAFLSMLGISSMNEIVNREGSLHASQILEKLRHFVISSLYPSGSGEQARDGIEVALCVIDKATNTLEFAGANRPLYHIRNKKLQQFRGDRMPIGIYETQGAEFTDQTIQLEEGDSIYLFSDGYVDQLGGPKRKTFRSKNFRQILLEIQDHSMEKQKKILTDRMEAWKGTGEQIDDVLIMGIKF